MVGAVLAIHTGSFFPIVVLRSHPKHGHDWHAPRAFKSTRGADGREHFVMQERGTSADHQLMADGHHAATVLLKVLQPWGRPSLGGVLSLHRVHNSVAAHSRPHGLFRGLGPSGPFPSKAFRQRRRP